jgi:hypothetical protein
MSISIQPNEFAVDTIGLVLTTNDGKIQNSAFVNTIW